VAKPSMYSLPPVRGQEKGLLVRSAMEGAGQSPRSRVTARPEVTSKRV
jgi:hypothetical protein